ncbi:MAG: Rrf2 family transcriptional regulator [Bacteroidia bacterium]|jgi:Rrf2 family protein|nr:Rrf2 family transcriptional regulator [Bacteroidia bacterium]
MNILSKTCQYAIRSLLYISQSGSIDKKVSLKEIAEKLEIPAPFLAKIMQQLSKRQLVSSIKGPKGGFYLTDKEKMNSLLKIMEAIDGLDVFEMCGLGMKVCSPDKPCPIHHKVVKIHEIMRKSLASSTIKKLETELHNRNYTIMR